MKKSTHKRLTAWLLTLAMLLLLLPTTALAAYPDASNVFVDGGKSFYNNRLYYKNGDSDGSFTGTSTDFNAAYDPATGTLTLDGYNGKGITVGGVGRTDITVKLVGTNIINDGSLENVVGGDITVTSSDGGTLSITQITSGSNPAIGIETGLSSSYTTGSVTIKGNAKVTINMTHNGTSTYEKAYGIYAEENITISENASVDITCATPNNTTGGSNCNGMFANGNVSIDTTGKIKIDVTKAGKDDAYSFGIYPMGTPTLTRVGEMQVQWKKHKTNTSYPGGAVYKGTSFDANTHAINAVDMDETKCYASYRHGTPYEVTVVNGDLTGPGVPNEKGSGMFLVGDTVNITPYERKSNSGEVIPFKEWTAEGVTLTSSTTADTSFSVPANAVTVTATYKPFDGAPVFARTDDSSGTIAFQTAVKPDGGSEYFEYVKVGKENDTYGYRSIAPQPTTASTASPYEYSVSVSTYYVGDIKNLEAGDYRMAVTLNGERYLSDPFTVNYVKPRPEISVSYWPDPTDFGSVNVGYDSATGRTLTIDNKGTADTGPLTITVEGANPEAFTVSPSTISNIAAGKSAMSTVRPATGLPAGTYTATLKISGDNVNTLSINMKFTVKDPNASATVGGTITSYGNASEAVTVTLLQGTSVIGSPQVLTGASGSAPYSQTYSFPTVPAGEYTLKVEKKGHAPWTEEITVGTDNIGKDVTVYLWGDVNRDGEVTAADAQEIQRKAAKLSSAYDTEPNKSYWILRADVNRDGDVTAADAQEIQRNAAKLSSAIDSLP